MSKESFKAFVKTKPELARMVTEGKTSWQKLYETYDLYGQNNDVWQELTNTRKELTTKANKTMLDIKNLFSGLDLNTVQKGVDGLQKAIGLLQDITSSKDTPQNNYEERPIYKYYED